MLPETPTLALPLLKLFAKVNAGAIAFIAPPTVDEFVLVTSTLTNDVPSAIDE